jgi:DNA polymerase
VNHEDANAIFHRRMRGLQDIEKGLAKVGVADVGLYLIIGRPATGNGAGQQEQQRLKTGHPVSLSSDGIMKPVAMAGKQLSSAVPWVPEHPTLPLLTAAAKKCEGCDLFRHATQTVFGEGPANAPVMLIGEQPGDQEDLQGKPFVGPAGRMLDKALAEAGVERTRVYVTNAVKHFKFVERGKRRIHGKPNGIEITACRPWLEAEVAVIQPELIVCLGATAAQALMGRAFRVTQDRGKILEHPWAKSLLATIHPSALLRFPDPAQREEEYRRFVEDLRLIPKTVSAVRI